MNTNQCLNVVPVIVRFNITNAKVATTHTRPIEISEMMIFA